MIPNDTWQHLAPDLGTDYREKLEKDFNTILSIKYMRFISYEEWNSIFNDICFNLSSFLEELESTPYPNSWQNTWIQYLMGKGDIIIDPQKINNSGIDTRIIAQYWSVTVEVVGKYKLDDLLGNARFDTSLESYSARDELWSLTGTFIGFIATRPFDILHSDPFIPILKLYQYGLRPQLFSEVYPAIDIPLNDGKDYRLDRYILVNNSLQKIEERSFG